MAAQGTLASRMFSESKVAICIAIGVLLIWIAMLIGTFGEGTSASKAMTALKNTGMALITAMLISGGVVNAKMERIVRIVMIIMGAIILLTLAASVTMWRYGLF